MKFINYLEGITGVGIYPLTSLILFFVFFSGLTVWVIKADKKLMNKMREMPLQSDENE